MPFGAHAGKKYADIPEAYLRWAAREMKAKAVRKKCQRELERRGVVKMVIAPENLAYHTPRYDWTNSHGQTFSLPEWMDMTGRENEECPF